MRIHADQALQIESGSAFYPDTVAKSWFKNLDVNGF